MRGRHVVVMGLVPIAVAGLVAAAVVSRSGDEGAAARASTTSSTATTTATTSTTLDPPTTTAPLRWPTVPREPARAVRTPMGVVLAVLRDHGDGTFLARTPCGEEATVGGTPIGGATVVLDPGHGGDEPGAVGPGGTEEKDVNLAIALEAQRQLEAVGATVVLTRTSDYRITLASRAAIATAVRPAVFISVHHNAEPDGPSEGPGTETYFQIASPESKRAAGLLYDELRAALAPYDVAWVADTDAGAKYRKRSDGTDYYGILHRSAGVPAVLSEAAFISNPPEEALLADPAFQAVEAGAIARAVVRYVTTDEPGRGYVEPYPRTRPAGPGGGSQGCVDPPLG